MANPNPNFLWLFLDRKHSQLNYGVDCGWLTEENWKSDTKMIRGGPIFSVSNDGDDDHGVMAAKEHDDVVDDNLYDATRSLDWSLSPDATALNPARYSQLHTLAHVAADHEAVSCNLPIPNGTADYTRLSEIPHQIRAIGCRDSIELQSKQL